MQMVSRRKSTSAADLTNNVTGPDPGAHACLRGFIHVCIKSAAVSRPHDNLISVTFVEAGINDLAGGLCWNRRSPGCAVIDAGMECLLVRYGMYPRFITGAWFEWSRRLWRNVATVLICHLFTLVKSTSIPCPHLWKTEA